MHSFWKHDLVSHGLEEAAARAKRHFHMRQLSEFNHDLKHDPDIDIQKRVQELMDSGALRVDERGDLYSSIPLGPDANQRILEASRIWQPQGDPDTTTQDIRSRLEQQIANYGAMTPSTLGPQSGDDQ